MRALTKVRSQLAACLLTYVANLVRDLLADLTDQSKPQSADLIQPDFVSTTEFDGLSAELIEEARKFLKQTETNFWLIKVEQSDSAREPFDALQEAVATLEVLREEAAKHSTITTIRMSVSP